MFRKIKRWTVALGVTALLAAAAVGTVAFAQTPPPATPNTQATVEKTDYSQVFLSKLAGLLGIDQEKLVAAAKQAGKDTVDDAGKNGDLTATQAENAKSRIEQGQGGFGFPGQFSVGPGGRPGPGKGLPGGRGFAGGAALDRQAVTKAAADKLGISETDLHIALRSGKTLSDLAKENNVSLQDVQSAMVAAAKPQLDQAVKDGKLTQQQEDDILARIQAGDWLGFRGGRSPR